MTILSNTNIQRADIEGFTPIEIASKAAHTDFVNRLLSNERCVSTRLSKFTRSIPDKIVLYDETVMDPRMIPKLDIEAYNQNGDRKIHQAASDPEEAETLIFLINCGADIDPLDCDGQTPLMSAAIAGNAVAVSLLIDHGADPELESGQGFTALDYAILTGNDNVVQELEVESKKESSEN